MRNFGKFSKKEIKENKWYKIGLMLVKRKFADLLAIIF